MTARDAPVAEPLPIALVDIAMPPAAALPALVPLMALPLPPVVDATLPLEPFSPVRAPKRPRFAVVHTLGPDLDALMAFVAFQHNVFACRPSFCLQLSSDDTHLSYPDHVPDHERSSRFSRN